jgi:hypothetical protein
VPGPAKPAAGMDTTSCLPVPTSASRLGSHSPSRLAADPRCTPCYVMNAVAAVVIHEQPVVSRFQLGLGPGGIDTEGGLGLAAAGSSALKSSSRRWTSVRLYTLNRSIAGIVQQWDVAHGSPGKRPRVGRASCPRRYVAHGEVVAPDVPRIWDPWKERPAYGGNAGVLHDTGMRRT